MSLTALTPTLSHRERGVSPFPLEGEGEDGVTGSSARCFSREFANPSDSAFSAHSAVIWTEKSGMQDFLPLHQMDQQSSETRRVDKAYPGPTASGAAGRVYQGVTSLT